MYLCYLVGILYDVCHRSEKNCQWRRKALTDCCPVCPGCARRTEKVWWVLREGSFHAPHMVGKNVAIDIDHCSYMIVLYRTTDFQVTGQSQGVYFAGFLTCHFILTYYRTTTHRRIPALPIFRNTLIHASLQRRLHYRRRASFFDARIWARAVSWGD